MSRFRRDQLLSLCAGLLIGALIFAVLGVG